MKNAYVSLSKLLVFSISFLIFVLPAQAVTKTWVGVSGANWNTNANWLPAGQPAAGDDVIITNALAMIINRVPNGTILSLQKNGAGTLTLQSNAANTLTITNLLHVSAGTLLLGADVSITSATADIDGVLNPQQENFTCSGIMDVAGTFTDNSNTGLNIISGALTITATGTWNTTTVTTVGNMVFRGGITNNNLFNAGGATFNATQALNGPQPFAFANDVNVAGPGTITLNDDVTIGGNLTVAGAATLRLTDDLFTVTGTTSVSGTLQDNNDAGVNTFNGAVTVNGGGSWTSTAVTTVGNMIFRGGISNNNVFNAGSATFNNNAQTLSGSTALSFAGQVTTSGTAAVSVTTGVTIGGTFTVAAATSWQLNSSNFAVTGATSVSGTFADNNNAGSNTFTGAVAVNAGGSFTTTAVTTAANLVFQGGIANNNTFNAGAATFSASQNISGTQPLTFNNNVAVSGANTVTNSGTVSITGNLDGLVAGAVWLNANGSVLNYAGTAQPMNTGTLNAATCTNTVNYNLAGAAQTVRAISYCNLSISNSGAVASAKTITVTAPLSVSGLLLVQALGTGQSTFTVTGSSVLTVSNVNITRNAQFNKNTSAAAPYLFNVASPFTGKYDFIAASDNAGTSVSSTAGSDLTLTRGGGGSAPAGNAYAVKTVNFTNAPNAAVLKFNLGAIAPAAQTNAATLILGNAFANNSTIHAATILPLRVNLVATNRFSLSYNGVTSASFTGSHEVTLVVNNSAGNFSYQAPNGTLQTVGVNRADVWVGTSNFANEQPVASTTMPMNNVKFVFENSAVGGSTMSAITVSNMQLFTGISGIVNAYTPLTANPDVTKTQLTVGSTAEFLPGDKIIVMQMKGATVTTTNNLSYGSITGYGEAGKYEIAYIQSISGSTMQLTNPLTHNYTAAGTTQVIRMPVYPGPAVITGEVTAPAWNGSVGGVVVFEVQGNLIFNDDIDVAGLGYRGGMVSVNYAGAVVPVDCGNPTFASNSTNFGQKGEGIATDPANGYARAPIANGGGGGNPHNSGGGGGSNYGSGATGGRQWDCVGNNISCTTSPAVASQGGNEINGGMGGYTLAYDRDRVFMGGGGGGGQQNDGTGTSGGDGGGIVIIIASQIDGNARSIFANGEDVTIMAGNDSGGGGGAGGSVLLSVDGFSTNPLTINVRGGKGGDVSYQTCHGNGGGGGGGIIRTKITLPAAITTNTAGGPSSQNVNGSDCANVNNPFYCATQAGAGGGLLEGDLVILPIILKDFTAQLQTAQVAVRWTTTGEKRNDRFVVEKSLDGVNFIFLTSVSAKVLATSNYQVFDKNPSKGANYYRLKMIDTKGAETWSKVQVVHYHLAGNITVNLYPNPSQGEVFLQIFGQSETVGVEVIDPLGRMLNVQLVATGVGNYRLEFGETGKIATGVYLVRVKTEEGVAIRKVLIQ